MAPDRDGRTAVIHFDKALSAAPGYAPALAVEFGRKVLYSTERPTFLELEAHVKGTKAKA